MATEFPAEYLQVLDDVITQESFTSRYQVDGAEFVNAKTVKVPTIEFDSKGTEAYSRFSTTGTAELKYTAYELDCDREKNFYIDAIEDADEMHLRVTNIVGEFEKQFLVPELDTYFFRKAAAAAKTKATTALSAANIKGELRNARTQMVQNGFGTADLFITADAIGFLEDAIDRGFSGEGTITDMVGKYNIFDVYLVPDERLDGNDFVVIGGGQGTVKNVIKRAANYLFAPGQHTSGDGYLFQNRWVYGNVALKNKVGGIYANKAIG